MVNKGWGDDLEVKSAYCPQKGPEFSFQRPWWLTYNHLQF